MTYYEELSHITDPEQRVKTIMAERERRVAANLGGYIALPNPVMKQVPPSDVAAAAGMGPEIKILVGWMVGIPDDMAKLGYEPPPGAPIGGALPFGLPSEEVALDFCDILNRAREQREIMKEVLCSEPLAPSSPNVPPL